MACEAARFDPETVTSKAGTVVFFLQNAPHPLFSDDHNMAIGPRLYQARARSAFVHQTKAAVFTVDGLTPGTYRFWCEVRGHAANGMVGTLTISP